MMDWVNGGWSGGDWVAMSTMMVLFWGGLIALTVWIVRTARRDNAPSEDAGHADALLSERFARGEIDHEEFTRSRVLLHSDGSSRPQSGR